MAHTVAAEAGDGSQDSSGDSNDSVPVTHHLDLSRYLPSQRADLDRDKILFKGRLPGGIRWLFQFERLGTRDLQTEQTLRIVLILIAVLVVCSAAIVVAMALSA